jgi:hypothetical protein
MKLKGVVLFVGMAACLYAAEVPPLEASSQEMLDALFEGMEHLPVSYLQRFRFIDIESLLEDSIDLERQFQSLSDKQKQELIDTIDQFNQAIAEALFSIQERENTPQI